MAVISACLLRSSVDMQCRVVVNTSNHVSLPQTLLPNLTSVIYMDTDTLFFVPPKDLWVQFDSMYSAHLVAMALDAEERVSGWYNRFARHPFVGELGVNSGIMLMRLERMRERKTNWTSIMEAIFHRYYKVLTWGDQDMLNIFFHFHQGTDEAQLGWWHARCAHQFRLLSQAPSC